ncbi:hypothetical protein Alsa2_CDS0100 [Staphylococcus phage Alsa_2]|nr:hypothetical protein Alsa2_CDS0100 [Staphylococcus phage Alsa_2]
MRSIEQVFIEYGYFLLSENETIKEYYNKVKNHRITVGRFSGIICDVTNGFLIGYSVTDLETFLNDFITELDYIEIELQYRGYKKIQDTKDIFHYVKSVDNGIIVKKESHTIYLSDLLIYTGDMIGNTAKELKEYFDLKQELTQIRDIFAKNNYHIESETYSLIFYNNDSDNVFTVSKGSGLVYKGKLDFDEDKFVSKSAKELGQYFDRKAKQESQEIKNMIKKLKKHGYKVYKEY